MTERINKHYPADFKQEAVALVIEQLSQPGQNLERLMPWNVNLG
jgi:transposase-like protein